MLKRIGTLGVAFAAAATIAACDSDPTATTAATFDDGPAFSSHGNGAPQGAHDYQLLIIGTGDKNPDMTGNVGHRIFVPLYGKVKIFLEEGPYEVLDANATDNDGGRFQLPAPGLDAFVIGDEGTADVYSDYSVYIRPLGKPGGFATITTCAELLDDTFGGLLGGAARSVLNRADGDAFCSIEQVGNILEGDLRLFRDTGKSTFSNVTAELLTIVFEVDVDGTTFLVRVPIFDDSIEGEYWEYDNHGLRVAQIRFYDCSTNVATGATSC